MRLKDFFKSVNYCITDGSEYCWGCFGSGAYQLGSYISQFEANIIFDKDNQVVYEVTFCDFNKELAYRWQNPKFVHIHRLEARNRRVNPNQAWDAVSFKDISAKKLIKKISSKMSKTQVIVFCMK